MMLKFSSNFKATATCSLLFSPLVLMSKLPIEPCPTISEADKCPAGCWFLETEMEYRFAKPQCSSVGYGYYSKGNDNTRHACPPGTFSDSLNAQFCQQCEAGAYAPSIGSRFCDLCPAGSFSGIPGSHDCRSCRDDYYKQSGSNAVKFWEGEYYCTYIGLPTTIALPTASPSATRKTELERAKSPTTFSSTAPTLGRSEEPTSKPSFSSSSVLLSTSSTRQLTEGITGTVTLQDGHPFQVNTTLSMCDNIEGHFEWHGRCKQCPIKVEAGLYPFLIFVLFGALITVLQSLVPLCSTSTVWAGIEYLQVLYLVSLCGISWSPLADVIFEKVVPVFGLDFSANFSLQCFFGWPMECDQVFMVTLPLLFWLFLIAFYNFTGDPLTTYESGLRCLIIYIYLGLANFLQTSIEACDLFTVLASFFSRLPSTNWYAAIAGVIGVMFYGLVFPHWFHRAMGRYYKVVLSGMEDEKQDHSKHDDFKNTTTCSCLSKVKKTVTNSSYADLLLTLGLFPSVRDSASWWPLFWMIRKLGFIFLVTIFPRSPLLLLVILLVTLFVSEVIQRCVAPFPNKCEERMGNKWFHSAKVDAVLQVCAVAMVGLNFLIVGSDGTRTKKQGLAMDTLVLVLLSAGVAFWLLSLGFASTSSCEDCPRFATLSTQLLEKVASFQEEDNDEEFLPGDGALEEVPLDDTPLGIRCAKLPPSQRYPRGKKMSPKEFIPPTIAMLRKTGLYGEEIYLCGHDKEIPTQSPHRHQSVVSGVDYDLTAEDDNIETFFEDEWIASKSGKKAHISSYRPWTHVKRGRLV